jgi:regulator of sigma E protease
VPATTSSWTALAPLLAEADKKVETREIDQARLPFELRQWATRNKDGSKVVTLKVRRQVPGNAPDQPLVFRVAWPNPERWQFDREVPLSLTSPMAIPELGLGYKVRGTVSGIDPGWKDHPLKPGDVIKQVRFWYQNKKGEIEHDSFMDLDEPDQWAHVFWAFQHSDNIKKMTVKVQGKEEEILLKASEDKTWPMVPRGMLLSPDQRIQKADSMVEAVEMGLSETWDKITQVYQNLRGMITGRISVKNLGGPITIARVAYSIAGDNFWQFVFFLGMISINLAVVNFLPIPVLDGGHMVFLIYEKIRGKRPSESVQVALTLLGLGVIILIFVFVTFLDFGRIFGW